MTTVRTHSGGRTFYGEASARTSIGLWRDGDIFIEHTTGTTHVRTDGAWVIAPPKAHTHADSDTLPNGDTEGDFLRWDGDSWAVAAEPLEMASGQIILTPALAAALDIEGGIFYKSTDKSVYVCTDV